MIAAQAAARAHHRELERASKEESLRRSQLRLGDAAEAPPEPEIEPFVPVPDYLLNVPLKDHDSEEPDVDTFLIVAKRFNKQYVYRFHASKSLFLFGPRSSIRKFTMFVVTHQWFEVVILLTILTNCIFMALSDSPDEAEYVFAAIYTVEMFLKILARGFALHKYAYLRNAWNWLDFLVVILGYVTMIPGLDEYSGIRTFRVLRALRTISAVKGLKAMVNTLLKSIKMLSDVLILTTFFLCVFALIGLQLFVGIMSQKCVKNMPAGTTISHEDWGKYIRNETNWYATNGVYDLCGNGSDARKCPGNYTCLRDTGPNFFNEFISYDNFLLALLNSLQLVTMDYWESIYNSVIACMGTWYVLYFIFVIFLGPFYLINLVLAVVSLSYEQETSALQDETIKHELFIKLKRSASTYSFDGQTGHEPMFEGDVVRPQEEEPVSDRYVVEAPPETAVEEEKDEEDTDDKPKTCWQKTAGVCKVIVSHSAFEFFITLCILLNTLAMALEYHKMDLGFKQILEYFNLTFTGVFIMEMILKLMALGGREYVKNRWNCFDGTIVVLSVVDMVMSYTKVVDGAGLSVLRTFRLLRVLKLAQSWKTMGDLLRTIGSSVGPVGNITLILGIIVYMFAVVGMNIFGKAYTKEVFNGEVPRWNFNDFGHSFMMIFRILCGKWIEPLWWTMRATDDTVAILFILPVFVIGNFIILNLFLALLLNSFGGDSEEEDEEEKKKKEKAEKKKKKKSRLNISKLLFKSKNKSGSRTRVGPEGEENSDDEKEDEYRMIANDDGDENENKNKKDAANTLSNKFSTSNDGIEKGSDLEMGDVMANGKNTNGVKHPPDDPLAHLGNHTTNKLIPNDNRHSLTTKLDLDDAALRIRDLPVSSNKRLPSIGRQIDEMAKLEANENNLSNGDLVGNGSAPVVLNGNSRQSAGSERSNGKDLSIGDIDSRIPSGSPPHDSKRDTIVTVDTDAGTTKEKVRDCCPAACYCNSLCCNSYRDSCIRRGWHNMRWYLIVLAEHKYFEAFILFMILISSLTLVFEDVHLSSRPQLQEFLSYMNYIFAVTFTLEFLLKIVGFGVIGYFSNLWNCLDFFIVAISLASMFEIKSLNAFRSLRALRPLRAISRFEGMKIVVNSLVHAVPAIANILVVCMVFWLIFSIMGYQLFGGMFWKCIKPDGEKYHHEEVPDMATCLNTSGAKWINSKINFDSSFHGFLALFQVATLEGVFEVMDDSVDAVGIDKQPIRENNFYNYLFYVIFIILGSFFILNLFIGVIIENFNRLKQQYEDSGALGIFLTPGQRSWVNAFKKTWDRKPKKQPKRPTAKWRAWVFDLIHQKKFEVFIMTVILLNMLTMMIQHHNQSEGVTLALLYLNFIFTGIFILEAIVRLIALRFDYFKQGWNIFDFTIVIFSIVGIVIEDYLKMDMPFSPGLLRVVRVFRLGRLLRFFEGAKGVRRLLFALVKSLPGLVNIAMLLFLIIFIYSIIGMSLFGYVKKWNGVTEVVNFETFGNSMLLLFRIGTAAGWNTILDPIMQEPGRPPYCDPDKKPGGMAGDCGIPWLAVIYFVSYITLLFLIIVNMYIAVILENFNEAQSQDEIGLTDDDFETYIQVWENYDTLATHFISYKQLGDLLDDLDPPLRIPKPNISEYEKLDVPLRQGNKIYCLDLLQALVRRVLGNMEGFEEEEMTDMVQRLEERFSKKDVKNMGEEKVSNVIEQFRAESVAAQRIQKAFRVYQLQRKVKDGSKTKFHKYEMYYDKADKDVWEEKQLEDGGPATPTEQASLERVIGMLWYNQEKRMEDQRVEIADESKEGKEDKEVETRRGSNHLQVPANIPPGSQQSTNC